MLTKEECLKAIEGIKKYVNADNIDYIVVFKKLIDEHFCDENEKKIMLNAEKFRDEVLEISKTNDNIAFNLKEKRVASCRNTLCNNCLFKKYNGECTKARYEWLLSEYKEPPILDEVEREYLSAVCRPYKVLHIRKRNTGNKERQWLDICTDNVLWKDYDDIHLPYFKANTMYKGMELGKEYTPQELGIKCRNNPNGEIKHD